MSQPAKVTDGHTADALVWLQKENLALVEENKALRAKLGHMSGVESRLQTRQQKCSAIVEATRPAATATTGRQDCGDQSVTEQLSAMRLRAVEAEARATRAEAAVCKLQSRCLRLQEIAKPHWQSATRAALIGGTNGKA
jgi:hypothetical protein